MHLCLYLAQHICRCHFPPVAFLHSPVARIKCWHWHFHICSCHEKSQTDFSTTQHRNSPLFWHHQPLHSSLSWLKSDPPQTENSSSMSTTAPPPPLLCPKASTRVRCSVHYSSFSPCFPLITSYAASHGPCFHCYAEKTSKFTPSPNSSPTATHSNCQKANPSAWPTTQVPNLGRHSLRSSCPPPLVPPPPPKKKHDRMYRPHYFLTLTKTQLFKTALMYSMCLYF